MTEEIKKYSYWKTFVKGIKWTFLFLAGSCVAGFPIVYAKISQITIGALLIMFFDWLKHKWGLDLP